MKKNLVSEKRLIRRWFWPGVLVLLLLSACTPDATLTPTEVISVATEAPTPTPTPTPEPTVTATPLPPAHLDIDESDLEGVVVRFVHPWSGDMADTLAALAAEFSLSNPWDIWVQVESPGSEDQMFENLELDLAENKIPGLIAAYPYQLAGLSGAYYAVHLTDYFDHPVWGFSSEAQADFVPSYFEPFQQSDELVALPVAPQAAVLFLNETWVAALDQTLPLRDEKDFKALACAAAIFNNDDLEIENNGTGGWLVHFGPQMLMGWYFGFDGDVPFDQRPAFDNDQALDAFSFLKGAYDQGCVWIGLQPDPYAYFAERYAVMFSGTLDQIPMLTNWMAAQENDDVWSVMGLPTPEGDIMVVDGPGLMVTADTPENQIAAWLFARYLLEPDSQARIVESGFTLPVRESAIPLLADFSSRYPQWASALAMVPDAKMLPVSTSWGVTQWVLQDAAWRIFQTPSDQLPEILSELDATINELLEMMP